jgi:glyoxylase-like metal-dependent hydrolase (beta-lactamase superfamily II)
VNPVFANSAIVSTPEWLVLKGGRRQAIRLKVRYGIFRHPDAGLMLIDTGYGPRVRQGPRSMALTIYSRLLNAELRDRGQPKTALSRLGARLEDVRAVVITHFHADHVACLDLFPQARILARLSVLARVRARGEWQNLRHGVFAELLPADVTARITDIDASARREAPLGLGAGYDLLGDGSMLAVDLPGHAEGHFGICFTGLQVPLLYAVDAQWLLDALPAQRTPGFPSSLIADNRHDLAESARRVQAFRDRGGDVLLCHDPADSPHDLPESPA